MSVVGARGRYDFHRRPKLSDIDVLILCALANGRSTGVEVHEYVSKYLNPPPSYQTTMWHLGKLASAGLVVRVKPPSSDRRTKTRRFELTPIRVELPADGSVVLYSFVPFRFGDSERGSKFIRIGREPGAELAPLTREDVREIGRALAARVDELIRMEPEKLLTLLSSLILSE